MTGKGGLTQLAHARAYELEAGGFRGVAQNLLTGAVERGEVRTTIEEARNDAKRFVFAWAGDRNMTTGTYRSPRGWWRMNYFIRTDEAHELFMPAALEPSEGGR